MSYLEMWLVGSVDAVQPWCVRKPPVRPVAGARHCTAQLVSPGTPTHDCLSKHGQAGNPKSVVCRCNSPRQLVIAAASQQNFLMMKPVSNQLLAGFIAMGGSEFSLHRRSDLYFAD